MINLQKGQRIEMGLKNVCVGLGWDPNATGGEDFDLDASAFMLGSSHKLPHDPSKRPNAADWETALLKTLDLLQPCQNPQCNPKWYVFNNTRHPKCPFCGTEYQGQLPILNLYYSPRAGIFKPENHRVMVYDKQSLYPWHVNRFIVPNEKIKPENKKPVGDFHFHKGRWILINRSLPEMYDKSLDTKLKSANRWT